MFAVIDEIGHRDRRSTRPSRAAHGRTAAVPDPRPLLAGFLPQGHQPVRLRIRQAADRREEFRQLGLPNVSGAAAVLRVDGAL